MVQLKMKRKPAAEAPTWAPRTPGKLARLVIVLAGIVLGQAVLYGPSLVGRKVLLPLDLLATLAVYLPATPEFAHIKPEDHTRLDLLWASEPARRFAGSEYRAGRLPLWAPYQFAGAPFVWPKFSPFYALQCVTESPVILAWTELLAAVVSGVGAYLFLRRVLALSFWPCCLAAWCYPLTGFFVLCQGFGTAPPVHWLPWVLLAVDKTTRRSSPFAPIGLSVVTGLVLVSGNLDVACQVLLVSGLYVLWVLFDAYGKRWLGREARKAIVGLALGWGLGLLLAAPYVSPLVEYTQTGARMARRNLGGEERPPVGLPALPQVVLPDMYGSRAPGSLPLFPEGQGNIPESTAATYAGLLATLVVAPLALRSRRHLASNGFWLFLALFGLSWSLDVPGFVAFFRLPGVNMMSHNRLVFATAFAIIAMTAVGLEVLIRGPVGWRWWFWIPAAVVAGLCAWCVWRTQVLPETLRVRLEQQAQKGYEDLYPQDMNGVRRTEAWFTRHYAASAVWCGVGLIMWAGLNARPRWQSRLLPVFGILLVGDLLWFGFGRNPQGDPALYFPRIPVLDQVAQSPQGRIIGYGCLPPGLAEICGLRDIKGYDAVDPARLMDLMATVASPESPIPPYAMTHWLRPKGEYTAEGGYRLPAILDMLGVRYVIFRGQPPPEVRPVFQGQDYWCLTNPSAMPRSYVPRRVELVTAADERVQKLSSAAFDPREVAYVETPVSLPDSCRGMAEIVREIPTRIVISLKMETAGLVVLADLWDKGWRAFLDTKPVPILRANHAVRGVVVPPGAAKLEFRYEPASFAWGLRLCGLALVVLLGWLAMALRTRPPSSQAAKLPGEDGRPPREHKSGRPL